MQIYSKRKLSYETDILQAFTGITSALQKITGSRFVTGLPDLSFLRSLLWMPSQTPVRRRSAGHPRSEDYFPSWSWIGWIGPVHYALLALWNVRDNFKIESAICYAGTRHWIKGDVRRIAFGICGTSLHDGPCSLGLPDMTAFRTQRRDSTMLLGPNLTLLEFWASSAPAAQFHFGKAQTRRSEFHHVTYDGVPMLDSDGHQFGVIFGLEALPIINERHELIVLCYFKGTKENGDMVFGEHYGLSKSWCGCVFYILLIEWKEISNTLNAWLLGRFNQRLGRKSALRSSSLRLSDT